MRKPSAWISGMALFSMFFGAGNVVFPLLLGQQAGEHVGSAFFGLTITAVLFPLIGLLALMLYNGDYDSFFGRIGRWPGWIVLFFVNIVQGPTGAVPRLFTVSYASLQPFLPSMGLWIYSALAACLVFILCIRKNRVIDLLGSVFTPILLLALGLIIALGIFHTPNAAPLAEPAQIGFTAGLKVGYGTTDLISAFLFGILIMGHFRRSEEDTEAGHSHMIRQFAKASLVAAALLSIVYGGLCLVTSRYAAELAGLPAEKLIGSVAHLVLGPYGALVSSVAVAMACLTTAISLITVFSDYIRKYWFGSRIGRIPCLAGSLLASALMATQGFDGIMTVLNPILDIVYPGLIVLCGLNIAHKLYEFRPVKIPVMTTFGLAAFSQFV